jgi:hypothetical protein
MSNPALNTAAFLANRLPEGSRLVAALRGLFVLNFAVFRLGLNTQSTWHFLRHSAEFSPPYVPAWHRHFIAVALVLGFALQWVWGWKILKIALSGKPLRGESNKIARELMRGANLNMPAGGAKGKKA